jgi:hypothetical protein
LAEPIQRTSRVLHHKTHVGLNGYAVGSVKIATGHGHGSIEPGGAEVLARSSKEGRPQ